MFTSHKQISPPSLVLKLKISEVSQKWIPKAVELKRIPTHKKCKCKKFCSQTRLVGEIYSSDVIMHRGYRADFFGEGTGISGRCLTNRFGSRFGTSTKLFRGVIGPISTPNDSLNVVFDDIISLCGSCRNNALPRSPREKLQLVAILSLRVIGLSLQ